jgi:hypothetical protein
MPIQEETLQYREVNYVEKQLMNEDENCINRDVPVSVY